MFLCTKLYAVLLSVFNGVGGCRCPRAIKAFRIGIIFCAFKNKAPVSASAADATTWRSVLHSTCIGAFRAACGVAGGAGGFELKIYE